MASTPAYLKSHCERYHALCDIEGERPLRPELPLRLAHRDTELIGAEESAANAARLVAVAVVDPALPPRSTIVRVQRLRLTRRVRPVGRWPNVNAGFQVRCRKRCR